MVQVNLVSGIVNNNLSWPYEIEQDTKGSNLIAISRSRTQSDETFLAINTHQPLEGPTSWYEAHLVSEGRHQYYWSDLPWVSLSVYGSQRIFGLDTYS